MPPPTQANWLRVDGQSNINRYSGMLSESSLTAAAVAKQQRWEREWSGERAQWEQALGQLLAHPSLGSMQRFACALRAVRKSITSICVLSKHGESIKCPCRKSINNIYERSVVSVDKCWQTAQCWRQRWDWDRVVNSSRKRGFTALRIVTCLDSSSSLHSSLLLLVFFSFRGSLHYNVLTHVFFFSLQGIRMTALA